MGYNGSASCGEGADRASIDLAGVQLDCMPSVHPAFAEAALERERAQGKAPLELRLSDLPTTSEGALDASPLLRHVADMDSVSGFGSKRTPAETVRSPSVHDWRL